MKITELAQCIGKHIFDIQDFGAQRSATPEQALYCLGKALGEWQASVEARLAKLESTPVKAVDGDWMVMKGGEECGDVNVIAQMGSGAAVTSTCKLPTGHQGRHVDGLFQWWNKSDPTAPPIGHCIDDGSRLGPEHWTGVAVVKREPGSGET